METIRKQRITNALRAYGSRYGSQAKAAHSMKGVSSATVSQMLGGNWESISDAMWRSVATQVGYKDEKWEAVETGDYKMMNSLLGDIQQNGLVMAITGDAGTGKTFACKRYVEGHPRAYMLCCEEWWNKKQFLVELLTTMGVDSAGYTMADMVSEAVMTLKRQESPLLILDEADKLADVVLYFFITLYNHLEDECGIAMCATGYLEKRLRDGIRRGSKGYAEAWSRLGRKCVPLGGVTAADVAAICETNGITDTKGMDAVIADCESDLRRVRRKVHAINRKRQTANETVIND